MIGTVWNCLQWNLYSKKQNKKSPTRQHPWFLKTLLSNVWNTCKRLPHSLHPDYKVGNQDLVLQYPTILLVLLSWVYTMFCLDIKQVFQCCFTPVMLGLRLLKIKIKYWKIVHNTFFKMPTETVMTHQQDGVYPLCRFSLCRGRNPC